MADGFNNDLDALNLRKYVGETVTIFTTSGGASGFGFTGVLISANDCFVRLVSRIGAPPEYPFGIGGCGNGYPVQGIYDNNCKNGRDGYGYGYGHGFGTGAVVVIPTDRISSFVHNTL